jgi:hypothetical protein
MGWIFFIQMERIYGMTQARKEKNTYLKWFNRFKGLGTLQLHI